MLYRNKQNGNLYEVLGEAEKGVYHVIDMTDTQRCSIRAAELDNTNLFERVPSTDEERYALKIEELKDFIKGAKDFYSIKS